MTIVLFVRKRFKVVAEKLIKKIAKRCANRVEKEFGQKNFLGTIDKCLEKVLPIIIEELLKEMPKF